MPLYCACISSTYIGLVFDFLLYPYLDIHGEVSAALGPGESQLETVSR